MKPKFMKKAGRAIKRASPTILTCIGAFGIVATAVLAVKATPKALELVKEDSRKKHDGDPYAATKLEVVKSGWKCYVPAILAGTATITCVFGANILNKKQQASLIGAYSLVSRSYTDYKHKVKELYGKEAHEKIMQSLAVERANPHRITAPTLVSDLCLEFEDANEEERLFYDSFSKRYFQATISQVLQAEYHLNRNFALGGDVGVNNFYELLGLEPMKKFNDFGWWVTDELYWIDFDHTKTMVDDGLNGEIECYVIDMVFMPGDYPPD